MCTFLTNKRTYFPDIVLVNGVNYDLISVGEWARTHGKTKVAKGLFEIAIMAILGTGSCQISMAHALAYVKSNHGLVACIDSIGGLQDSKIVGGTSTIIEKIYDKIKDTRVEVLLNHQVTHVSRTEAGSYLVTATDPRDPTCRTTFQFLGTYVVSSLSPPLLRRVGFTPPLPPALSTLCESSFMGVYGKWMVSYQQPFWRAQGYSGNVTVVPIMDKAGIAADTKDKPVFIVYDACHSETGKYGLMGFANLCPGFFAVRYSTSIPSSWKRN